MQQKKNDLVEGAILPSLLKFAVPVLLALVLQALYGAVDLWAVGKFGTTADISAVSTGSQTMQIITGIVTGLSMGTTILLGQCIGQKDDKGAAGAAIATVAAQVVSVALFLVLIKKKGLPFRFAREDLSSHRATAERIIKLGSPIALQDMCNEISYLIIIGLVNALGVEVSAGVGIAEKLVIFILLIPMSYMQSISAFVSQNVGAGKQERARRAMWKGMGTALILGGITAYVSYFHGDALSMLFVKNGVEGQAAVIRDAADFLRATSIECFILSIAYCLTGYFNGCGKTGFVMLQGLGAIFLVKIPYAYYASRKAVPQLFDIGLSTAYAALFTLAVCLIYYWYMHERECEKYNKKTS